MPSAMSINIPEIHRGIISLGGRCGWKGKEMFYLTTHSTHFIYGYMASDILWLRTILIVRKETCCRHIGYTFWLTARVLLYAPSHRQDSTYHGHCYTSRGALDGTRNSSMGPPHEGSIRRPIAPWANALTTELHLAPLWMESSTSVISSGQRKEMFLFNHALGTGCFFQLYNPTDRMAHSTTFVTPVVEYRLEREIGQWGANRTGNWLKNDPHCRTSHTLRRNGRKCFIKQHTQHILFTVIWHQTYGKWPFR